MASTSNLHLIDPSLPVWDVFLSFYGKDTRRNFIANLYFNLNQAGILTFRDDPALEKGEEISPGIRNAIKNAKKFVVVISENYARSSWCLDELVEILGCKQTKNQVVPVFYYVNPSDVRYQKGSFGEALEAHKKCYSVDMVNEWKFALSEIAKLSGYLLKHDTDENESDTIQKIVEDVAPQASGKVVHLEKYLVGIDYAIKKINKKLNLESNDVRTIGICGMGGIGKTTIATEFYNRFSNKFDIACYIQIVRQNLQGGSPLLPFLEQLLIELLRRKNYKVHDAESGIRKLKEILCSKTALIVLDDLDQACYLELVVGLCNLLYGGSRIIITTRDVNLLNQLKVDITLVDIHMVTTLGVNESLQLFSHHAFRKLMPPECFRELSVSFVRYAGGLPLALKVLGSYLRGRTDLSFWKSKLEELQNIPEKVVQKILWLSYDGLDDETEKPLFLDIAFFFVGQDKDEAVHTLKSCGYHPDSGITILVERCLLTIDEYNKFQMHNLVLDMGRKFGESKGLFWRGNSWEDLHNLKGTNEIEGLILDLTKSTEKTIPARIFERLPNLRLLEIIGAHDISGNFINLFGELRCIRWTYCPWTHWPSRFRAQKLVSVHMPFNQFKALWKYAAPLVSLKTINLSYSKNLTSTHDLRDLKLVERLLLRGCKNLLEVHPSIGELTNLFYLDLGECHSLEELPQSFGQLKNLGRLDLGECDQLKELPETIGLLTNLGHFDLHDCHNLKRFPEPIKHMNLGFLDLSRCCNLKVLPEQLCDMHGLKSLNVSDTGVEQLPDQFGRLTNLVTLQLSHCRNLTSLPNSIRKLKLLKYLYLNSCSKLKKLPEQLGRMQSLETLEASDTAIEELPDSIGLLSGLTLLKLEDCEKLKCLPNSIRELVSFAEECDAGAQMVDFAFPHTERNKVEGLFSRSLRCDIAKWLLLILSFSSVKDLCFWGEGLSPSFDFSKLSKLRFLGLYFCKGTCSSFPRLPLNLTSLAVCSYAELEQLPDLSRLKHLRSLTIRHCDSLQSLSGLPPHLCFLFVAACRNLKSVTLKQSSLQVGRVEQSSFTAFLPNKEIPKWFDYKSRGTIVSLDIPPLLGGNFFGVALWVVYKCENTDTWKNTDFRLSTSVIITNQTESTETCYELLPQEGEIVHLYNCFPPVRDIQSVVWCKRGEDISVKSGDRIKVSLLCSIEGFGEVKVEMCGAHVLKNHSPYQEMSDSVEMLQVY